MIKMPFRADGIVIIVIIVVELSATFAYVRYILAGRREEGERSVERASDVKVSSARKPHYPNDTIREVNCERVASLFARSFGDNARSSFFLSSFHESIHARTDVRRAGRRYCESA